MEWLDSLPWYGHMLLWGFLTYWAFTPYYVLKALDRIGNQNDRIIQLLYDIKQGRRD